ncbi:hypothetical protein [Plantactinospora sp. GCM10030261]|uniref:hypothetical protein n=1 Tax=Plantactinospora sp. GCM10030261 TaxID=3273420 RepID=UPI00360A0EF1
MRTMIDMFRGATRRLTYCALLLPVAVAALAVVLAGRPEPAVRWWRNLSVRLLGVPPLPSARRPLGVPPLPPTRRPGWSRTATHTALSLLLGATALIPVGLVLLFVSRGVLYGVVDPGPYDTAWGGPSRGGAWLAHFLVGVPIMAAGLAFGALVVEVHRRLTAALTGRPTGRWVVPVALLLALVGATFVVAWTRQI